MKKKRAELYFNEDIEFIFLDTCRLYDRGFCDGCHAIEEEADIHYSSCPTDFDMCSADCVRYSDVEEIVSQLRSFNSAIADICRQNRQLGDSYWDE